ncbi:MAG: hypothetical protein AB7K24_20195, partial [Gemmataceae bacterium]
MLRKLDQAPARILDVGTGRALCPPHVLFATLAEHPGHGPTVYGSPVDIWWVALTQGGAERHILGEVPFGSALGGFVSSPSGRLQAGGSSGADDT